MILCLKMDDMRFRGDDKDVFKILTDNWKGTVEEL